MDTIGDLIDEIIGSHRVNNHLFNWNDYIVAHGQTDEAFGNIYTVKQFLEKEDLVINFGPPMTTKLTLKGRQWTSYAGYRKELKLRKQGEKGDSVQKKYWWLLLPFGIILGIFSDPAKDFVNEHVFHKSRPPVSKQQLDSIYNSARTFILDSLKK